MRERVFRSSLANVTSQYYYYDKSIKKAKYVLSDHPPFVFTTNETTYFVWNVMGKGRLFRLNLNNINTRKFSDVENKDEDELHFKIRCKYIFDVLKSVYAKNVNWIFLLQEVDNKLLGMLQSKKEWEVVKGKTDTATIATKGTISESRAIFLPTNESSSITGFRATLIDHKKTLVVNVHVQTKNFEKHLQRTREIIAAAKGLAKKYEDVVIAGDFNTLNLESKFLHILPGEESNGDNSVTHIVDYAISNHPIERGFAPLPIGKMKLDDTEYRIVHYITPKSFLEKRVQRDPENNCHSTLKGGDSMPATEFIVLESETDSCTLNISEWVQFLRQNPTSIESVRAVVKRR